MFGSVFGQAVGFLDRRFVLNVVLPSLAFWGGLALLAAQGAGWEAVSRWWTARTGFEQTLLAGGAVAGVLIFAFIAAGLLTSLTRLWEGYWPGSAGSRLAPSRYAARLAKWRVGHHVTRWRGLDLGDDRDYMRRFYQFPVRQADVLPTRLGNVLRAAEDYPGDEERYGMDAVFYWPRLYLILPAETRSLVNAHRSGLDRMVLLASLTVLFPFASLMVLAVANTSWMAWGISALIAIVIGVLAYEGAVNAAVAFGDVIRSCFDNYRRTLLEQLGLPLPGSLEDERKLWGALKQQLYQRGTDDPSVLRQTRLGIFTRRAIRAGGRGPVMSALRRR
jgi:hypothetical protein